MSAISNGPIARDLQILDKLSVPEEKVRQNELELRRILALAMGALPMTFRDVLRLREVEEHSIAETARMLGLSTSAVKSRALRGRQKLRRALSKHFFSGARPRRRAVRI